MTPAWGVLWGAEEGDLSAPTQLWPRARTGGPPPFRC